MAQIPTIVIPQKVPPSLGSPATVGKTAPPSPPISVEVATIQVNPIDAELQQLGYTCISKVCTQDNSKELAYIKASNANGQTVYISLDTSYPANGNSVLLNSPQPIVIPHSLKKGAYECAGPLVPGITFECSNGICIIARKGNSLQPKENNYALSTSNKIVPNSVITYPIVLISEIKTNPQLVLNNTDIVTRRLRNSAYKIELEELEALKKSIDNLQTQFGEFNNKRNDIASKLNRTIDELEAWNAQYMTNPFLTEQHKARWRLLQYNLTDRNNKIATLLQTIKQITLLTNQVDKLSNEISNVNNFMNFEFANVEFAITE